MKTSIVTALLYSFTLRLLAQNAGSTPTIGQEPGSITNEDIPYAIVQNDANSRVWERTTNERGPSGQTVPQKHNYIELATGLNHLVGGKWVESKEEIDILADGTAQAVQGQHQAYFPGDIYEGPVELVTPDGRHMKSKPVGIIFDDGINTVLIAELTNSVGQVLGSNQVIYTNAFSGLAVDLRYTYKKNGFEQDVVLRQRPPVPESLGLNPATTHMQILTEFFDTEAPIEAVTSVSRQDGLADTTLIFGKMKMVHGKAFSINDRVGMSRSGHIPVYKSWLRLDGRTFLAEALSYQRIMKQVEQLPASASSGGQPYAANSILYRVSPTLLLPPPHLSVTSVKAIRLAGADLLKREGMVIDYDEIDSDQTDFTFEGNKTYYVSGEYNLSGTTTFQGGAVIKSDYNGILDIDSSGTVICQTAAYQPVVLTSINDASAGENISGASGTPSVSDVQYNLVDNANNIVLKNMRFKYSFGAVAQYAWGDPQNLNLWDCQILTGAGILGNFNLGLHNVLIDQSGVWPVTTPDPAITVDNGSVVAEHLTADDTVQVIQSDGNDVPVALTNCLLTGWSYINTAGSISTQCVVFLPYSLTNFNAVGGGYHYLPANSVYRSAGTTNINPALLAALREKTTFGPIMMTNAITQNTNLIPVIPRDTNSTGVDIGYHYDRIDYLGLFRATNVTVTLSNGVVFAANRFTDSGGVQPVNYLNHCNFASVGTATRRNYYLNAANLVQEQSDTSSWWTLQGIYTFNAGNATLEFTSLIIPNGTINYIQLGITNFTMQNCESYLYGGGTFACRATNSILWNNLFVFPNFTLVGGQGSAFNNTFTCDGGGNASLSGSSLWTNYNNIFDHCNYSLSGTSAYNAYLNGATAPTSLHTGDVVTNVAWKVGFLGSYYQPNNSPLINAGSTNADLLGLFHFTTQTNQIKETNSIVDIGYHYVALDSYGNPDDTDGDGVPDFLEDANGDGLVDNGEASWLLGIATQPQNQNVVQGQDVTFSVTPGGTAPFSYQWKSNGTDIAGANNYIFTKLVVTTNDEANYSVVVTNFSGSVTSSIAVLSVNTPLSITASVQPQTVLEGTNVSFSVTVSGNYPVYQWFTNGTAIGNGSRISGATSSTLTISNVTVPDALTYTVVVSNLFNSVSSAAGLTVIAKPIISLAPSNTTIIQSEDLLLSGLATGQSLSYQWWLTNILGTAMITNATQPTYSKLVVQTNDAGHYSLVVTNPAGSTNMNADLTVLVPPWITQQPASATNNQGANVTFSVSAFGTAGLFYQWYKYGTNALTAATNATLALNNIQTNDAAGYTVLVTNLSGTNLSAWAWLSVIQTGGGTTNYGWGSGSPPTPTNFVSMIDPTNILPDHPAVHLYGNPISIRASAFSHYSDITNVTFYFTATNFAMSYVLAGTATPGSNAKFALAWTNAVHGTNIVKAVAWDCNGNSLDSTNVYVIMDQAPQISTIPSTVGLTWEGITTNVWFTNYVSDDGLPSGTTNISWSIPSEVTTSNVYTYTSSNIIIATQATFTNWGTYSLWINVSDGFASSSNRCTVTIRHRPSVHFNWPTNNAVVVTNTLPLVLDATGSDLDGTVADITFYDGTGLTTISPGMQSAHGAFRYAWSNPALGVHLITAIATDNDSLTSSTNVICSVVPPLTVQFNSPTNNQFFAFSPTNIFLTAYPTSYVVSAITSVVFTNLTQSIYLGTGTVTNSGYQVLWTNLTNGTYAVSVTARDSAGNVASNGVVITVNAMPTVSITVPVTNLQLYLEVTNVTLTASASDSDGTITNIEFYSNTNSTTPIASGTNSTCSIVWSNRAAGYHGFTAVATDDHGAKSVSEIRVFKVTSTNPPPGIAITYPTNNAVFADGSDITITAIATNGAGSVTNVQFFVNEESIGSDSAAPYEISKCCWRPGSYTLTAKAADNIGGSVVSTNIHITIAAIPPAQDGFWDPTFHTTNVYYKNFAMIPCDQCGNPLYLAQCQSSCLFGDDLYLAANDITSSGDIESASLYRLRGTNWFRWGGANAPCGAAPFESGYTDGWDGVGGVAVDGTGVYAAGYDYSSYQSSLYAVWRFDGTNWIQLGGDFYVDSDLPGDERSNGINQPRIQFVGSELYLFGDFEIPTGTTNIQYIAKWNVVSNAWQQVGTPLNGSVWAVTSFQGNLVIGGQFTDAGGNTNANHIAELIGGNWENLGSGVQGTDWCVDPYGSPTTNHFDCAVFSLAASDTNLFVGGDFTSAGDQTNASSIAIWNGAQWRTLGSGLRSRPFNINGFVYHPGYETCTNAVVYSISVHCDTVYVGGAFSDALNSDGGDVQVASIARVQWNEDSQQWGWSDMDVGIYNKQWFVDNNVALPGIVLTTLIQEDQTTGAYDVIIGGSIGIMGEQYIGAAQNYFPSLTRWRVGQPQPQSVPKVTITSPVSPAIFTNPAAVFLTGVAISSYTNINTANFYTNGVGVGDKLSYPVSSTNYFQFTNEWDFPSNGVYLIKATARDDGNLVGESQPLVISIKSTNNSIFAIDDQYSVQQGALAITLPVLTNDSPSVGLKISQITLTGHNLGTVDVGYDRTFLTYRPFANVFGRDVFYYSVTNAAGAVDSASVTVRIVSPPVIFPPSDGDRFVVSTPPITLTATAFGHDIGVTNIVFYTNGVAYKTVTNGIGSFSTNWSASAAGFYTFVAVATDNDGFRSTSAPVTVALTNTAPSTHAPTAAISNLGAVTNNNQGVVTVNLPIIRSGVFDLLGQASDLDGDPVSYAVQLFRPEDWNWAGSTNVFDLIPITEPFADVTPGAKNAQGFHIGGDVSGDLGNLDLTHIPDGVYDLVLRVRGGTDETSAIVRVQLQSDLKIGQFSFSEQDLVLPVNGIPLTVTRTYNSLNLEPGAFGASWTFALNDMDVKMDDERTDVTIGTDNAPFEDGGDTPVNGLPKVVSMRTGGNWDVTLTLPDGRRTTFTFGYYGAWPELHAQWTAPAGITAKLEPSDDDGKIDFGYSGLSVPIWKGSDLTTGYAPFESQDFPGWILTTADGTKYHISRGTTNNVICLDPNGSGNYVSARVCGAPKLTEIDQLSGDRIVINTNGIFNYDPTNALTRWTLFERDSAGRITALHDPNGGSNGLPAVKYVYNNDTGNLIQVLKLVNRSAGTYTTNKYHYDNLNFPHYITSIENGDGVPVARNSYDDSGRLTAVQDANGTLTQFNHSLTNKSEVVIDRLQHTNSYVYNLNGNVIWATNALGQVTAATYNDLNNVNLETAVTNAYGTAQATWTLYSYDSAGNQTNVVSMGHTNSFEYDGNGNLLTQVDPLGNVTRNLYDSSGNLTNTVQYDANNNPLTQSSSSYDNGKLSQTLNANGQPTATFGYDGYGNLTSTTDANGFTRSFGYDDNGNQTSSSYQWTPPGGSPVTVATSTEYDALNRVTKTVDALGNTNRTFYNTLGKVDYTIDKFGNTNSFIYDALGNLIQTAYPNNTFTRTVYDAGGRAYLTTDRNGITGTRTDFDAAGRATNTVRLTNVVVDIIHTGSEAESVVSSAGTPISTNSTVYDAAGRVTSRTGPDGTTAYEYYPDGQLMRVIDALNNTNFYAYDLAGRQTNVVDALNHSTKFFYDALGRMTNTLYADNTGITNIFDNLGQRTGVRDQAGLLTQFAYSISGQLTNVIKSSVPDPDNNGSSTNAQWSYLYDSYGRPTVTIDPKGHGTTNFFDAYGRQFSQRLAMNQTNLVVYNSLGQAATNYDFLNQRTEFYYDRFGRLTNKFYFVTGVHPSNSVSYVYNQLDQLTNITERYGSDADSIYAANNFEKPAFRFATVLAFISRTAPRWGGVLLPLLALGCVLTLVPSGRRLRDILVWYYVRRGAVAAIADRRTKRLRLPSFFWRAITIATLIVLIVDDPSWDNAFNARATCDIPSNSSTLTTRNTNFVYDLEGRLKQVNAPEGVINYTYDLATSRLQSTCTDYSAWDYTYDGLGRLKTVHVSKRAGSTVNETTTYTYDGVGNRSSVTLPSGLVTTYLYDSLNRLTNLTHKIGSTTNAAYNYVLDATGRRTNAVEVLLQEGAAGYLTNTLTWQFDGMYRLTNEVTLCSAAGGSYTNSYSYNLAGNRLKQITRAGNLITITNSYDPNDELLREVTQTGVNYTETNNYAYDLNGSMIGKTNIAGTANTNTYQYDLMNKLGSVALNGTVQASYQYNAQGIRVRGTSGGTTNYYLVDANNHTGYQQVLEEYTVLRGSPTRSYVLGDDVLAQTVSGADSYLLYDGHGSTRQMADHYGAVASRYNYDAYGSVQVTTSSSTGEYAADHGNSFLYCGEQYDSKLQMYNLRARYYNPGNGRFSQRDAFAGLNSDPQSLHKYTYCHNDPLTRHDPSGHWAMIELLVAVALVSAAVIFTAAHGRHGRDSQGGPWRVAFVSDQFGEYRVLYSQEAAELKNLRGKVPKGELTRLRGLLKDKYQQITPPEVESALRVVVGEKYDKRLPTGNFNPESTSQTINQAGQVFKVVGRVFVVLMLYSEYEKVVAADDWDRQLGSSSSGLIGSIGGGSIGASVVGGTIGALGGSPVTVAIGAGVGGYVGGIEGYDLFSGAYDELWDILYPE